MNPLPRLFRYARPYRGRFAAALAAMLVYAGASTLVAYLIAPIINKVLPARDSLTLLSMAILVAYVAKGVGSYFSTYLMTDIGQRVVRDVRNQLFRHVLDQSAAFFSRRTSGQLMSRITSDVNQVQQAVSETLGDLLREGLALVGYAVLMFYFDWRLALVVVTSAPIIVYPLVRLGQRVRRSTRRSQEEQEHLSHLTAEAFTGHRIVKAFAAEAQEARRFAAASHRLYRTNLKVTSTVSVLPPLMEFLGGVAIVGLLWYGSRQISSAALSQGAFLGFIFAAFMMYTPIKKLSRVNANLQQATAAATRIFEVLDTHTEVPERPGAVPLTRITRGIEYRHVSFAYDDGGTKSVLRDVSFEVRAGQMIALVGLSGAGKTTLANLLPRFYDVTGGAILIDGQDIRDFTLKSLRQQIGIVTQETVLFDETIAANIAYGVPDAPRSAIEEAARAAHAHEFILMLPHGYDTRIGERGQRLSGGQRQRLAIARALLKNSPILILDEATSSLDVESEQLVQDALANLMRNRTSFVIAHRLSTVRRADSIIALERGRIAEIGRHDELLARPGGVYAKLYALQLFDRRREAVALKQIG
ncbi:MAG TPA: lipid A export permease/ATP-binding protein MsbA [Vicinamibacterales bacterium]|nr:lipid A export permease/ATP-binding protein MsbA [Vicinamibacterales bacterium]